MTRSRYVYVSWQPPSGVVTGYQLYVNGQPVGRVLRPSYRRARVSLPQGAVTIGLAARDLSGAFGTMAQVGITVDSVRPPRPSQLAVPAGTTTLTWAPGADTGTARYYQVRVNGAFVTNTAGTSASVPVRRGKATVTVMAIDAAGNRSSAARLSTYLDTTAPSSAASWLYQRRGDAPGTSSTSRVTVKWNPAADGESGLAGYQVTVAGSSQVHYRSAGSRYMVLDLPAGTSQVQVSARNRVGLVGSPSTVTVTVVPR